MLFSPYIYRQGVQAVQVSADNASDIAAALPQCVLLPGRTALWFAPPPGHMHPVEAYAGDWIVTGPDGAVTVWSAVAFQRVFAADETATAR